MPGIRHPDLERGKGMKKIKWIILGVVLVAAGAAGIAYISQKEKDKQYPFERYQEEQAKKETTEAATGAEDSGTEDAEGKAATDDKTEDSHSFTQGNVTYSFLALDVIPDTEIETQTRYPAENFASGNLPDADYETWTYDYDKMMQEGPALKEIYTNKTDYTPEEYQKIRDENDQAVKDSEYMGHPKTDYYFVKMQIKNESQDKVRDVYLTELRLISTNTTRKAYDYYDAVCYFSAFQHTEGDDRVHSFLTYSLQPGEVLDCIVGFEARRDRIYPTDQFIYAGLISPSMDEVVVNPAEYETSVLLDDLPGMEE